MVGGVKHGRHVAHFVEVFAGLVVKTQGERVNVWNRRDVHDERVALHALLL